MTKDTPDTPPRAGLEIPSAEPPRRPGLDLSGIAQQPKPRIDPSALTEVTRNAGFTSRVAPAPALDEDVLPPPRRRLKRAPPMVQFNGRVRPDVLRRIHAYCEAARISNGEFLEQAIESLEKDRPNR